MNKKVILWVILLILLTYPVFAVDLLELRHTEYKSTILPKESAIFYLTVENNQNIDDSFRIIKPGVYWDWIMETESLNIPKNNFKKVKVSLTPFDDKEPGDYGISLDVESLGNNSIRESELFEISMVSYAKAFSTKLISSDNINPNKENLFRIEIINNYDLDVSNLTLVLESDYFKEEKDFVIRPYETLELEMPIKFSGTVQTGDNPIFLKFYHYDAFVLEKEEIIDIGYFTDVTGLGTPEEGFLHKKLTVVRTNEGNIVSKENFMKRMSFFEKLFTSTNPSPDRTSRDGSNYILEWVFNLNPDETKTITVETDYRFFVLGLVVLLLIVGGLYYFFRKDINLEKKVVSMKKGTDGFYSLNVVLTLRNKTLRRIKNIKVMDRLGGRVDETFNFGTLKPILFRTEQGKSTKLVWNISSLEKRGEIILQYTMKYKPYVIKTVPSAIAKYWKHGRPLYVKSNRAEIFS